MRITATIFFLLIVTIAAVAPAQPVCDFSSLSTAPSLSYTRNNGTAYTTFTPGSRNWEIISSGIANPSGTPKALHTNPSNTSSSPQYLVSQAFAGFDFQYNQLTWSFWMGRRADNGSTGGSSDRSTVWLYLNRNTSLTNFTGLEGIRLTWYHYYGYAKIQLVEVYGGTEHIIAWFYFLPNNPCGNDWGSTFVVRRIPAGTPTGTQVRYQILSSTPPTNTPSFSSYNTPADADPVAASTYMRVDTLLSANDTWVPTGTSGRIGVMSDFSSSYRRAAEYNQLCVTNFGPVPVELSSFSASYRNDRVVLDWHTATELNNSGFEIQRSINHDGTWESIGFVDGHGTTNSPQSYRFTDNPDTRSARTIGYRLKQIDRDGSYEYSNTVIVSLAPSTSDVLYNFPNPFNPATTITFTLDTPDVVSLAVFNAAGEKVATLLDNASMPEGSHSASFDGTGLPSGRYIYQLTTAFGKQMNSMVLSK